MRPPNPIVSPPQAPQSLRILRGSASKSSPGILPLPELLVMSALHASNLATCNCRRYVLRLLHLIVGFGCTRYRKDASILSVTTQLEAVL